LGWPHSRLREFVISGDEKTSIQAGVAAHPGLPQGRARMMRINHEYTRGGALTDLAAYDVHQARVLGRCAPSTRGPPSRMRRRSGSSKRWDNGSSYQGEAAIERLATRFPNAVKVHTPTHLVVRTAEIYFSQVQRKVFSPNDFTDLADVEQGLACELGAAA